MKKNNKLLVVTTVMALSSGIVNAAPVNFTYNFANIADKTSLPGDWGANPKGEKGGQPLTFTKPTSGTGPGLSAYGYKNVGSVGDTQIDSAYAYLDSKTGMSSSAGLGVCGALDQSLQCSPGNDDNITQYEMLKLEFINAVSLTDIFFKNGDHNTEWNDNRGFFINDKFVQFNKLTNSGGTNGNIGHLSLAELTTLGLANASKNWTFLNLNTTPDATKEFYISSISGLSEVPVPAAVWLMGSGFLGLMGISRRHKAAKGLTD